VPSSGQKIGGGLVLDFEAVAGQACGRQLGCVKCIVNDVFRTDRGRITGSEGLDQSRGGGFLAPCDGRGTVPPAGARRKASASSNSALARILRLGAFGKQPSRF
jgi:hypothetical protein